jgi:hypothetical protein
MQVLCSVLKKATTSWRLADRGDWDRVRSIVGDLMEPQDAYPERWRVRVFPNTELHEKIGQMM